MHITQAAPSDLPALTELYRSTILTINLGDYTKEQTEVWASGTEDTEKWLNRVNTQYFIMAQDEGKLLGFASIDDTGYLDMMFVSKDRQGQGVATALLTELERYARDKNIKLIHSEVSITARPFFERRGYTVKEIQNDEYKGTIFINHIMTKSLD